MGQRKSPIYNKMNSLVTFFALVGCAVADPSVLQDRAPVAPSYSAPRAAPAGPAYEEHVVAPVVTRDVTRTEYITETKTHRLRVPVTSDIWVTDATQIDAYVTVYETERRYIPERADTVTSYIAVTAPPIAVVTASRGVVPTRAVTTEYTSFVTSVTDVELWQTVTHTYTQFQGYTEAVYETQDLKQLHTVTVTNTQTQYVTRTRAYNPYGN